MVEQEVASQFSPAFVRNALSYRLEVTSKLDGHLGLPSLALAFTWSVDSRLLAFLFEVSERTI